MEEEFCCSKKMSQLNPHCLEGFIKGLFLKTKLRDSSMNILTRLLRQWFLIIFEYVARYRCWTFLLISIKDFCFCYSDCNQTIIIVYHKSWKTPRNPPGWVFTGLMSKVELCVYILTHNLIPCFHFSVSTSSSSSVSTSSRYLEVVFKLRRIRHRFNCGNIFKICND